MRTTCRLVKMRIWSYIEPITECIRKNSLISKFVMHCYQTCFMIGLRNDQIMILVNHIWCYKASSAQGVKLSTLTDKLVHNTLGFDWKCTPSLLVFFFSCCFSQTNPIWWHNFANLWTKWKKFFDCNITPHQHNWSITTMSYNYVNPNTLGVLMWEGREG